MKLSGMQNQEVKHIPSATSNTSGLGLGKTNTSPPEVSYKPNTFPLSPNADVEIKRSEQQMYADSRRLQVEARYAQQERAQQDKDKLKPKPGERIVTVRGKKIIKTETVPYPAPQTGKMRPKPGDRVVTMRGNKVVKTEIVPYPQQQPGTMRPKPGERVVTMTPSGKILKTEIVPEQPVKPTLTNYARQAEKLIQGAGTDVRERNRAISGAYASLYLQNPEAFAWLGAAAYASGQVGFLMDILDTANAVSGGAPTLPNTLIDDAARDVIQQNAGALKKMMAEGNLTIFKSIFPVSLAYQEGGIQELRRLESTLKGEELKRFTPLRQAYEQIDKGVKLNQKKAGTGDTFITEGTDDIIDFEQRVIAQPLFNRHPRLVTAMGALAFGDLDADDSNIDWKTLSVFQRYSPAGNFGDSNTRIDWIENEIFIKWDKHRTERADEVRGQMYTMIIAGHDAGGRY